MNDESSAHADDRYSAHSQHDQEIFRHVRAHARELGFEPDQAQISALRNFQRLYEDLIALERMEASLIRLLARKQVVRGIYLWGGVGRGKSFLMDSFFDCAPTPRKRRIHFHRFMQEIHHALHRHQGAENPMAVISREMARQTRLLCLDEFHITDITDAMLMRRLLEGLFECGVVLVTTSNLHPDELYRDGLQRTQFVPAIELIKKCLEIVNVNDGVDYRLRELESAGVYHVGANAEALLERTYLGIAGPDASDTSGLEIENRIINVRRHGHGVAWLDFGELCDGPRGKADYIELARRYHTVLISGIPAFGPNNGDVVRRFTWLIDEFYDRRVKLIASAAAAPEALFPDAMSGDQFERTVSRLTEMQTHDYLGLAHLP